MKHWSRMVLGVICGVVATGPMTAAMVLGHRHLRPREKYPLPPNEITNQLLEKAGVDADADGTSSATLLAHFAYGGAAGGLYGALPGSPARSSVVSGVVLGTLVWSVSYLGILPSLKILRPATQQPAARNALMLGAHFIWGVCLCTLHALLQEDEPRTQSALHGRGTQQAADQA